MINTKYMEPGGGVYLDGGSRTTLTAANKLITYNGIHDNARWDRTCKPAVHFSNIISQQTGQLLVNSTWGGVGATDHYSSISPNLLNVDPLFMDEATGDLNLRPDSPAFAMDGFVLIPFDEIGIRSGQDMEQ